MLLLQNLTYYEHTHVVVDVVALTTIISMLLLTVVVAGGGCGGCGGVVVVVGSCGGCREHRGGSGSAEEDWQIHETGNGSVEALFHDYIRLRIMRLQLDSGRKLRLEGVEVEQVLEVAVGLGERHG